MEHDIDTGSVGGTIAEDSLVASAARIPSNLYGSLENKGPGPAKRTRDDLAAASKEARKAAKEGTQLMRSCRRLQGFVEQLADVLQTKVDSLVAEARRLAPPGNQQDVAPPALAEKYQEYIAVLRRKARRLEQTAGTLQTAAIFTGRNSALCDKVSDGTSPDDSERYYLAANSSKEMLKEKCLEAAQLQFRYLSSLKAMWIDARAELADSEEIADPDSSNEYSRQACENQDRKTRVAGGVAVLVGALFIAVALLLFKWGSDAFIGILLLGILMFVCSLAYWCSKLYKKLCKQPEEEKLTIGELSDTFLEYADDRLDQLHAYFEKVQVAPLLYSSNSDEEDADA